ncbi:MAG: GSU2403 family nucleotidyltransferase fold protein [Parvibaculum sp.]
MPSVHEITLTMQTAYADLLDRCSTAAFDEAFPDRGSFVAKKIGERTYWYFQSSTAGGRTQQQKYVGPETPELLDQIAHHREAKSSEKDRRSTVAMLVRSAHLPAPRKKLGDIIQALAAAGVFRLRGVMIGTSAYQTYSAMLGYRLPLASMQTGDVDIAQYLTVSVAVEDSTAPMIEVLKSVDPSFDAVMDSRDGRRSTRYRAADGVLVDFLTPEQGPTADGPQKLPALNTDGDPLRFLDFLIHDPVPAVVLHGSGVYVSVPNPNRFAVHKLIVAQRRRTGEAKKTKDIVQAEALLNVLVRHHQRELKEIWTEAWNRGPKWRRHLAEGLWEMSLEARDRVLQAVEETRGIVMGVDLQFFAPQARYDFDRDIVTVLGQIDGEKFRCSISREALEDHFDSDVSDKNSLLKCYRDNRTVIEKMMQYKFLNDPIDQLDEVLIKSEDVPTLLEKVGI